MGQIGVLNVGAGDTKLSFDKNNPAEMIRSARIVTDMLRRGYALLVEVTDKKDFGMIELWDDRAIQIEANMGRRVDGKE